MQTAGIPVVTRDRTPAGELWTTEMFLDEIMRRHDLRTDYQLHKVLKVTKQTIYRYRSGSGSFDESVAVRVAELLDMRPEYVLLATQGERAKTDAARAAWRQLAARAFPHAAMLAAVVVGAICTISTGDVSVADQALILLAGFTCNTHYAPAVLLFAVLLLTARSRHHRPL